MLSFPSQLDVEEKIGLGAMAGKQIGFADPLSLCFLVLDLDLMWFPASLFCICTFSPFFNRAWRSCQGGR